MGPGAASELGDGGDRRGRLFELPPELAIDADVARRVMVGFIRNQLRQAGFSRGLLGLSGGIDSALVAFLVAEAVGPESLLCVLMPYRTSSPESVDHARLVIDRLGCAGDLVDISPIVDGYFGRDGEAGAGGAEAHEAASLRRGNFMARTRMCVLYDRSVPWGGLVVGTGNKTEEVPEEIIRKAPSADLWPGQTDEVEAGFSYPELDRLLFWMIDKRRTDEELLAMGFPEAEIARVKRLVAVSEFKRQVPPVAKLGPRTTGVDYLYPRRRPGSARP